MQIFFLNPYRAYHCLHEVVQLWLFYNIRWHHINQPIEGAHPHTLLHEEFLGLWYVNRVDHFNDPNATQAPYFFYAA